MNADRVLLDRATWTLFRRTVSAFRSSQVGGQARAWFAGLLLLLLGINALNVVNSYVGRDFMTAIEGRDTRTFLRLAGVYIGVFAASALVAGLSRFCEERLGLLWREWLTRRALDLYLARGTYFWMRERRELENPDQRISEDIRYFTSTTLSLLIMALNATLAILSFSGVLWSISPTLFVIAVGYACLGTVLTVAFGRPLVSLNYHQLDREADFRSDLLHLRENAESIVVAGNEAQMRGRIRRRIEDLAANAKHIIAVNRNLAWFTSGYNYLIQIIPALIVAPLFIRGEVEFGVVSQSAMAFSLLLNAFSLIVTQFPSISSYAAVIARLANLDRSLEPSGRRDEGGVERVERPGPLSFENLTLRSPGDDRVLIRGLDASIEPGSRVLVSGPGEAAKLALFRAIAGIWSAGSGRILHPPPNEMQLLAERPYLAPGTLRQALEVGIQQAARTDTEILSVLHALRIEPLVHRAGGLDVERDWGDVFSIGDQQLLAMARVLLAAPRIAILHQLSAVLSPDLVSCCLERLAERGIGYVVMGELNGGPADFDAVLELERGGAWSFGPAQARAAHPS